MPDKDVQILQYVRTGNSEAALSLLIEEYKERLYWHIRKMVVDHDETDDLLQDVFIRAWKSLGSFRAESGLYTWLYRIATNLCLTHLRSKKKRLFSPLQDHSAELTARVDESVQSTAEEIEVRLQKAIIKLPEKQRIVFNMKYFDDIKYKEMSEILNTSVGSLKASYHHAVKKIQLDLKRNL